MGIWSIPWEFSSTTDDSHMTYSTKNFYDESESKFTNI